MALKTLVKINQVNNLSDARYCAGMGVEFIGFHLDPTDERVISPEKFAEITNWISGVKLVGEFFESGAVVIKELVDKYKLDFIQINNPAEVDYLFQLDIPLILNISITNLESKKYLGETLAEYKEKVAYFLITKDDNGEEDEAVQKIFLEEIALLSSKYPILLGFGISPSNVNSIIENTAVAGLALQGGEEIKPGYKDFDGLAEILEEIEVDDLS